MIMKKILALIAAAMLLVVNVNADNKPKKAKAEVCTVTFGTNMHCENCQKKITENLSYLKGVKDLKVSLDKQEITVKYDASKTNETNLEKEIKKLGYKAEKLK